MFCIRFPFPFLFSCFPMQVYLEGFLLSIVKTTQMNTSTPDPLALAQRFPQPPKPKFPKHTFNSCKSFRLQLKRGLFWYHIIQNCTKWSNIGLHGLSLRRFGAKLRCASFLTRKNEEKWQYGPTKTKKCWFSWKQIFEKLHASHQSWKKQEFK